MRVGFIGLGMMGKGMAANSQKAGQDLVVHDLSRAAAEPFLAKGAVWANSPKQVAEQTEIVFTSLPVPADVASVLLGGNGNDRGHAPRHRLLRHVDQFGGDGAQNPRHLRREKSLRARFPRSAAARAAPPAARWRSGSAATSRSSTATSPCSTQWATRRPISARSAPARSAELDAPVRRDAEEIGRPRRNAYEAGIKALAAPGHPGPRARFDVGAPTKKASWLGSSSSPGMSARPSSRGTFGVWAKPICAAICPITTAEFACLVLCLRLRTGSRARVRSVW
jgi:hypothetical protein